MAAQGAELYQPLKRPAHSCLVGPSQEPGLHEEF